MTTTVSQEAREAEVTQADRAAAQAILDTWFNRSVIETILARHRQSAERGEVVGYLYHWPDDPSRTPYFRREKLGPTTNGWVNGWTETPLYTLTTPPEAA